MKLALALSAAVAIFSFSPTAEAQTSPYMWSMWLGTDRLPLPDSGGEIARIGSDTCSLTETERLIGGVWSRVLTCREAGEVSSTVASCAASEPGASRPLFFHGEVIRVSCVPR